MGYNLTESLGLTQREEQVFIMRLTVKSYGTIAKELGISIANVRYTMSCVEKKISDKLVFATETLNSRIDYLDISIITKKALRKMGITTVRQLKNVDEKVILDAKVRGFGENSKQEALRMKEWLNAKYE